VSILIRFLEDVFAQINCRFPVPNEIFIIYPTLIYVINISTRTEHARATRIASQMDYNQINSTIDPLVKAKLLKRLNLFPKIQLLMEMNMIFKIT
jgi:hypothetical protein